MVLLVLNVMLSPLIAATTTKDNSMSEFSNKLRGLAGACELFADKHHEPILKQSSDALMDYAETVEKLEDLRIQLAQVKPESLVNPVMILNSINDALNG